MLIGFKCPHCQASLKAGSSFAGKTGGCPNCGKEVRIPEQDSENKNKEKETVKKE